MITGFLTFVFFFAIVGCILYGRKLIKRERVDAVFGNPERAKGGIHWVIVGSSFLLLIWLYYSWDIAKSFFPRSANELCQVGKVNESLMSLKYLFPIDERQLKSTSVIETETTNLNKIIFDFIYLDPPYRADCHELVLKQIFNCNFIRKGTIVICEHSLELNIKKNILWEIYDVRTYGQSKLTFLIHI